MTDPDDTRLDALCQAAYAVDWAPYVRMAPIAADAVHDAYRDLDHLIAQAGDDVALEGWLVGSLERWAERQGGDDA